jgi:iron complex transport system substrate-binding protein
MDRIETVAREIVDAAVKVHKRTGPGLLESVYEVLLARELERRGLTVERQRPVDVVIDGVQFNEAFRLDLLVEGLIVVEIKSVETFVPAHWKQVHTYIRLLDLRLGFLLNFGDTTMKSGIHRIVNRYVGRFAPSCLRAKTM